MAGYQLLLSGKSLPESIAILELEGSLLGCFDLREAIEFAARAISLQLLPDFA